MPKDAWLPANFKIHGDDHIKSLDYSSDSWNLYNTTKKNIVLVVSVQLASRWISEGILDLKQFRTISFGKEKYKAIVSTKEYKLLPIEHLQSPDSKSDALAFAVSMKESRKTTSEPSFHDAIYVEKCSRLLPTWTLSPKVEDTVVLGTWLAGGVVISTNSFRRLHKLTSWMPVNDLADIIKAAGLSIPPDVGLYTRNQPKEDNWTEQSEDESQVSSLKVSISPSDVGSQPETFSLPGRPHLEDFFNEHVVDIILHPEKYQLMGIGFPSAIVLQGPPGCGKTFAVERLVEFLDWPSYSIDSSSVGSPFIHDTSKKISEVFDLAIENAPSVLIIDEMESFVCDRQFGAATGLHHVEEVAEFLRRIPEATKKNVLIVAMTNMIDMIDPAILRRGRFDHIIEVGMPSRDEVESLLRSLLSKLPKPEDLEIAPLLDVLSGRPLSDSAFVIREAARLAAKEGRSQVDEYSLQTAIDRLPKDKQQDNRIGFR